MPTILLFLALLVCIGSTQAIHSPSRNFSSLRPAPTTLEWVGYNSYSPTWLRPIVLPDDFCHWCVFAFGFDPVQPTGNLTMFTATENACRRDEIDHYTVCDVQGPPLGELLLNRRGYDFPAFRFTPASPLVGTTYFDFKVAKYYNGGPINNYPRYPYTTIPRFDELVEYPDVFRVFIDYRRMYSPPVGGIQTVVTYNAAVNVTIVSEDPEPEDGCVRPTLTALPTRSGAYLRTTTNGTHLTLSSTLPFASNQTTLTYIPPTQSNMNDIPRSTTDTFSLTISCGGSSSIRTVVIDSRNPAIGTSMTYTMLENQELTFDLNGFDERGINLSMIVITSVFAPNGSVLFMNGSSVPKSGMTMIRVSAEERRLRYIPDTDSFGMGHLKIEFVVQSFDGFISPNFATVTIDVATDRTPFRLDLVGDNPVVVQTSTNVLDLRRVYFNFSEPAIGDTTYEISLEGADPLGVSFERNDLVGNPLVCSTGTNVLSKIIVCRMVSSDIRDLFSGFVGVYAPYEVDASITLSVRDLSSDTLLVRRVTISASGTPVPARACFIFS